MAESAYEQAWSEFATSAKRIVAHPDVATGLLEFEIPGMRTWIDRLFNVVTTKQCSLGEASVSFPGRLIPDIDRRTLSINWNAPPVVSHPLLSATFKARLRPDGHPAIADLAKALSSGRLSREGFTIDFAGGAVIPELTLTGSVIHLSWKHPPAISRSEGFGKRLSASIERIEVARNYQATVITRGWVIPNPVFIFTD